MEWTKDQQTIIDRRKGTLLVSAAAGSGKTAVLVQRILEWVVRDHKNMDEFLVVTFTKAAAGQMRSKIRKALEELQEAHPGDEHIVRQLSLIHRANIMTIDSFCKSIFNEHFHRLHLDPIMRIIDETEGVLMQEDVIERILEQAYTESPELMQELHGYLGEVRSNEAIADLIKSIHTQAVSFPYPMEWYEKAFEDIEADTEDALDQASWVQILLQEVKSLYEDVAGIPQQVLAEFELNGQIYNPKNYEKYHAYFQEECAVVSQVLKADGYRTLQEALSDQNRSVSRFTWKNSKIPEDHVLAGLWKDYAEVKKEAKSYVKAELSVVLMHQHNVRPVLYMLLDLSRTFTLEYRKEKQKKNCMDFADVEHYALEILMEDINEDQQDTIDQESRVRVPSEIAKQMRDQYVEIMIDEYQDSNDLQEAILTSIARQDAYGYSNLFMVGDVKQSIYRFRMARPKLFQKKYDTYDSDLEAEGTQKKIELRQNFRSRKEVLSSVNLLFYQLMGKSLGGIDYNPSVALCPGRTFKELCGASPYGDANLKTEILFVDAVSEVVGSDSSDCNTDENTDNNTDDSIAHEENGEESVEEMTLEARVIADKILNLCHEDHPFPVWNEEDKCYRPCTYRDIVILLRTGKNYMETYREVLMEAGIPVYAESSKGYFDSVEVKNILNMLSVIDNARDDIALTGVLRSPMVGITEEQLAGLRCRYRKKSIWDMICSYCMDAEDGGDQENVRLTEEDQVLYKLIRDFLDRLKQWKDMKMYCTIRELIWDILNVTGYYNYLIAMPHGNVRQANILKLIEKATAYENSSYRGLFDFLRYIERVRTYEQDFGEASVLGTNDNLVQIMTIHKSKGLEFPVVILGGCGKQFNEEDTKQKILVDPDAYLAVNDMNLEKHYYEKTEKRECIKRHMIEENLSEEMRILYVAMTRAQEKLIMVGSVKQKLADKEEYQLLAARYYAGDAGEAVSDRIPPRIAKARLLKCKSYLAWMVEGILHLLGVRQDCLEYRIITPDMLDWQVVTEIKRYDQANAIWQKRVELQADPSDLEELERRFGWNYEHMAAAVRKGKLSVSEIKKMSQIIDDPETDILDHDGALHKDSSEHSEWKQGGVHKGVVTDKVSDGAAYGTMIHLIMEKIPFTQINNLADVEREIDHMVECGILKSEDRKRIPDEKIYRMLSSSLGIRMTEADRQGKLYKEQQFVIGMEMKEVYPDTDEEDLELIQGIIDAYYEEDGELVLMDYKTDRVSQEHGDQELIHKYHAQLDYYQRTLEQLTGKRVKEVYIYSFALDAVIPL